MLGKPIRKELPQGASAVENVDGNAHFTFNVSGLDGIVRRGVCHHGLATGPSSHLKPIIQPRVAPQRAVYRHSPDVCGLHAT